MSPSSEAWNAESSGGEEPSIEIAIEPTEGLNCVFKIVTQRIFSVTRRF